MEFLAVKLSGHALPGTAWTNLFSSFLLQSHFEVHWVSIPIYTRLYVSTYKYIATSYIHGVLYSMTVTFHQQQQSSMESYMASHFLQCIPTKGFYYSTLSCHVHGRLSCRKWEGKWKSEQNQEKKERERATKLLMLKFEPDWLVRIIPGHRPSWVGFYKDMYIYINLNAKVLV